MNQVMIRQKLEIEERTKAEAEKDQVILLLEERLKQSQGITLISRFRLVA